MPNWLPIGPAPQNASNGSPVSGRTTAIAISPDVDGFGGPAIFIGTAGGGIWCTRDVQSNSPVWFSRTDRLPIAPERKVGLLAIRAIGVAPLVPRTLFASTGAGVLRSTDGGTNWSLASTFQAWWLALDPTDATGNRLWASALGNGVFGSTDGGTSWSPLNTGLPTQRIVQDIAATTSASGAPDPDPFFFGRSDSEGKAPWTAKGFNRPELVPFYPLFTIHPVQTQRLLFGFSRVYETKDRGDNWSAISPRLPADDTPATAITYGGDDGTIYVAYGSQLFVTFDGGGDGTASHWTQAGSTVGFGNITGIGAHPIHAGRVYVVTANGHVWRTADCGRAWFDLTTNLPRIGLNAVAVHRFGSRYEPWIFVGTAVGVYAGVDRDETTSWARYGAFFPDAMVTDLQIAPSQGLIAAATWGRGAFVAGVDRITVPEVTIAEFRDHCGIGTVAGGQGRFRATAHGFGNASLDYRWSAENAVILGRPDRRDVAIQAPALGDFAVIVTVSDQVDNEASRPRRRDRNPRANRANA